MKQEGDAKGEASVLEVEAEDKGEANGDDGAPGESPMYKPDDIVIGIATKYKAKYDQQECQVVEILSKKYKVKMLTGPCKGETHKYLFHCVRSKEENPEEGPPVAEGVDASVEEKKHESGNAEDILDVDASEHESGNVEEILDLFN